MKSIIFLLAGAASLVSANAHSGSGKLGRRHYPTSPAVAKRAGYSLKTFAKGEEFLNLFNFQEGNHNGGVANYVSESSAKSQELVWVNPKDESVHLRVSAKKAKASSRDAIKLVSKDYWSKGLFVIDVERMPQVCGTWPAVWMTSMTQSWPAGGEIDIIEYVNHHTLNGFSVHTTAGCRAQPASSAVKFTGLAMMTQKSQALNCDADATNSEGCGFRSQQENSAGIGVNKENGGSYVMELQDTGIKAWFFAHGTEPADLKAKKPNPWQWSQAPDMFISPTGCDISKYFVDLGLVINTNLGGTWPEGVWHSDNSYAGQKGSCGADTGYNSAADYILAEGQDFKHAYWKFRSLAVYQY